MIEYTLIDLGPGVAMDVNNTGVVCGNAETGGWWWRDGVRQTIRFQTGSGLFFTAHAATSLSETDVFGDVVFIPRDLSSLQRFDCVLGAKQAILTGAGAGVLSTRQALGSKRLRNSDVRAGIQDGPLWYDLNYRVAAPGWILRTANAINTFGQVVGGGLFNGAEHAYLLFPIPVPVDGVNKVEPYAGFWIIGHKNQSVVVLAQDTQWDGGWRELARVEVTTDPQLWIDTSTPFRRNRDYRIQKA